jgi:carbon monoxide dehydrogenase subunit G
MSISTYESRQGKIDCGAEDIYNFVTDIRNFERFIPPDTFTDMKIERDSCSFRVGMLGEVTIRLKEKFFPEKVIFSGYARQVNDFSLIMNIISPEAGKSEVKVDLSADMNPFLKMIADEPLRLFLSKLIEEMESFKGWKERYQDK